ncbi:MAG: CPBP family intramembrane metalloprotease [Clostridium sp.]|nr:CPBP family intramembrane metalloprotease [Clostridium sp.]
MLIRGDWGSFEVTEMNGINRKWKLPALITYVIVFYSIWTMWEFWAKPFVSYAIENECISQWIKSGIIKNLVWTLPAILLVQRFEADVFLPLNEMFSTKVHWLKYLPVYLIFTVYVLTGSVLQNGKPEIASDFGINEMIIVLFVGLTEEMVFRGWLLNATIREEKKWFSIVINAVMFLAIHFPVWIYTGVFASSFTSLQFLEIIALSVVFSCTFIKSRNILVPITLHMYWDLLVFMFI